MRIAVGICYAQAGAGDIYLQPSDRLLFTIISRQGCPLVVIMQNDHPASAPASAASIPTTIQVLAFCLLGPWIFPRPSLLLGSQCCPSWSTGFSGCQRAKRQVRTEAERRVSVQRLFKPQRPPTSLFIREQHPDLPLESFLPSLPMRVSDLPGPVICQDWLGSGHVT